MHFSGMMQLWKVENVKTTTRPDKTLAVDAALIGVASRGAALGYNPENGFDVFRVFVKNFNGDIAQLQKGSILYLHGDVKATSRKSNGNWWHSPWLSVKGENLKIIGMAPMEWDPEKHLDKVGVNWKGAFDK